MTTVQISIAGRGKDDAPLLQDMLDQIRDFFEIVDGIAASIAGGGSEQFDWRVVGLSKNSPASVTVEAIPRHGFAQGALLAARARDEATDGLRLLQRFGERPLHFNDNVLDAADRFVRRHATGLVETRVTADGVGDENQLVVTAFEASAAIKNIALVREGDPVHPYKELGSIEGVIENVGTDGFGRPFVTVRSRLNGSFVRCFLSGDALRELELTPVADVVWRQRRVFASGTLTYRSLGRVSQARVARLDFVDQGERLPQLIDIIDKDFTGGASSEEYLEKVRNGDA